MKNNGVIIIAIIVIVVILSVILIGLTHSTPEPVIQGEVEISDYRLSSKVPSRVMKIKVQEGDFVKKGDTVAEQSSGRCSQRADRGCIRNVAKSKSRS